VSVAIEQHGPIPDSNYLRGRVLPTYSIDSIVLHTMVGWIAGADARFKNSSSIVSAHYGVRMYDVPVWQWVSENDVAYHAGNWIVNLTSIGIEHEDAGKYNDPRPDILYQTSGKLVAEIAARYHIPIVRGTGGPGIYDHRDVSDKPTACPDSLDTDRIIQIALNIGVPAPSPVPTVTGVPVLGDSTLRFRKVVENLYAVNPDAPLAAVDAYEAFADKGLRAELMLAQAIHETDWFRFTGRAKADWHNPCGLGVGSNSGAVDCHFPTWEAGVRAHMGHNFAYFLPVGSPHVPGFCDQDPRHFDHKGYTNDVRSWDGHWAVPGNGYGAAVASLL